VLLWAIIITLCDAWAAWKKDLRYIDDNVFWIYIFLQFCRDFWKFNKNKAKKCLKGMWNCEYYYQKGCETKLNSIIFKKIRRLNSKKFQKPENIQKGHSTMNKLMFRLKNIARGMKLWKTFKNGMKLRKNHKKGCATMKGCETKKKLQKNSTKFHSFTPFLRKPYHQFSRTIRKTNETNSTSITMSSTFMQPAYPPINSPQKNFTFVAKTFKSKFENNSH